MKLGKDVNELSFWWFCYASEELEVSGYALAYRLYGQWFDPRFKLNVT